MLTKDWAHKDNNNDLTYNGLQGFTTSTDSHQALHADVCPISTPKVLDPTRSSCAKGPNILGNCVIAFYACATVEKRCRRHTAFGSVRLWVSACVGESVTQDHSTQWPGKQGEYYIIVILFELISPKLCHVRIWACDILITSKGRRSRSRQADHTISPIPVKAILPNSGHRCICICRYAD